MGEEVSLREFKRLDIRVGTVAEVERIPGSDKLYKLQVDLGSGRRQIITGLVGFYTADELSGKRIVVLTNLKSAKIFGQVSHGMLLAAEAGERIALLTTDREMPNGAQVT